MTPCKYCGKEHSNVGLVIPSCVDVLINDLRQQLTTAQQQVKELQSKLTVTNLPEPLNTVWHQKIKIVNLTKERDEAQQHVQVLREALEKCINFMGDVGHCLPDGIYMQIATDALSSTPSSSEWVRKEEVKVIIEALKAALHDVETTEGLFATDNEWARLVATSPHFKLVSTSKKQILEALTLAAKLGLMEGK